MRSRTRPRANVLCLALLACVAAPAAALQTSPAQETDPARPAIPGPSFEEVINLRSVGSPAASPDGKSVVFPLRSTEWKENRYDTELWMARPGEEPFQLTHTAKGSSGSPAWSPDGRWIAFLADRGDRRQIHLLRSVGGEALPLTRLEQGVSSFSWSPDGRSIALVAAEPESAEMRQRKEIYGAFTVEDEEFRQSHLWLVTVPAEFGAGATGPGCGSAADCPHLPEPRRLTLGERFTVTGFAWSPDGRSIAFGHQRDPLINSWPSADISVLTVADGQVRPLVSAPGPDSEPIWSPDGRWILYSTSGGDTLSNYFRNGQLMKIAAAGGTPARLAVDVDEDLGNVVWARDGIYALARRGTLRHLYRIDAESGRARAISTTPEDISGFDLSEDGTTVALVGQAPNRLPEVYLTPLARFRPVAVTDLTRQIADWGLGTAEVISWGSRDGTRIEGVLHRPRDFDPSRKYPLLVVIHGGPTGIDVPTPTPGNVYPIPQWVARGALVLRPNYRGSAGYGEAFRSLNVRNLGVGDAWDVLSGVDHLVQQGIVDTTRMGAMGWSQGGYISAFLTTTTNRFRAISVGAGISDWMTYYVNTDIHPFTRQYLGATPWDDPEIYAKTSPITYIKQARTPTLIQHGELDQRVPIANAYELFQGLQDQGVPTRLVVYKGFGHGIDKPRERLAATWHNWQWFARHLWGEEVNLPLERPTPDP